MAAVSMMPYPARDGFQSYPQHYAMYQTRPHQPQADVTQSIHINPYANYGPVPHPHTQHPPPQQPQQQQQQQNPQYSHPTPRSPQPSGSPVSEDGFKPSLPSISNLLGIADRPAYDSTSQHSQTPTQQMQEQSHSSQVSPQSVHQFEVDPRSRTSHPAHELSTTTSPRSVVPPPPMRNDSVLEGTQSPSTLSTSSAISGAQPYFVGSAINNLEPADQRSAQVQLMKRHPVPSQPNVSPYGNARYTASPYATPPGNVSAPSYYSPTQPSYPVSSNIYQQRPLPSNFPPPPPIPVQSTPSLPTSNPWEHHHYISPSSQATFPQSQDRYICSTCNKAFSRPSSLKIHSHSHTGEKPFRCPHVGCGKAFSVRSNMKRHERGCHGGMQMPHAHMI